MSDKEEKLYNVGKLYQNVEHQPLIRGRRIKRVNGKPVMDWFKLAYPQFSLQMLWATYCRFADFILFHANSYYKGLAISAIKDNRPVMRRLRDEGYLYARVGTVAEFKEVVDAYMSDNEAKCRAIKDINIPKANNKSAIYAEQYWKLMEKKRKIEDRKAAEDAKKISSLERDTQNVSKNAKK